MQDKINDSSYIYTRTNGIWNTHFLKLTPADGATYDYFGNSLPLDGDTLLVGAYSEDEGASNAGSVYVFTRNGHQWTENSKLLGDTLDSQDRFGWRIGLDGTVAVVSAYNDDDVGSNAGAAYIFESNGITWTQTAKLTASNGTNYDHFGFDVAVEDNRILIGAQDDDTSGGTDAGSAYIFEKQQGVWVEVDQLIAIDASSTDKFGRRVAIQDATLLISAHADDDLGGGSGSVYIYHTLMGNPISTTTIISYTYDPIYRLTHSTYGGTVQTNYHYTYDAVGNMSAFTETVNTNITRVDRTFNAANQMQTSFDHEEGTTSFTFDANGNLTQMLPPGASGSNFTGSTRYHFDQRNRLISSTINL